MILTRRRSIHMTALTSLSIGCCNGHCTLLHVHLQGTALLLAFHLVNGGVEPTSQSSLPAAALGLTGSVRISCKACTTGQPILGQWLISWTTWIGGLAQSLMHGSWSCRYKSCSAWRLGGMQHCQGSPSGGPSLQQSGC